MKQREYLRDQHVKAFIEWLRLRVRCERRFEHEYRMLQPACDWSCGSLFNAYENYCWRGCSFAANQAELDCLRSRMRAAVAANDNHRFVEAACRILQWGGVVSSNKRRLCDLGQDALPTFRSAVDRLDPDRADTSMLGEVRYMNSGWTKVYALMLDGFPIYDGRVGAGMGHMVRLYCTECGELSEVPALLRFRWLRGKGSHNRNPSVDSLEFPNLIHGNPAAWAECNVWSAWILGAVCDEGKFGEIFPEERRLRALEAALFMIGYELPASG